MKTFRVGAVVRDLSVCLPLILCGAVMRLVVSIDRYDAVSFGAHAVAVRRVVSWRFGFVAVWLPAVAVLASAFAFTKSPLGWCVTALSALALAEVFSVCLHRESYIAAFEPWNIPRDARPLGGEPNRPADRRLHYLVRTHTTYAAALIVACCLADLGGVRAELVALCFVVKYIPAAWLDYEAYSHWDMHTNILQMAPARTRLETFWRMTIELLLGPAVGALPWVYSVEHIRLHHPYNAGPRDVHSPLAFDRWSAIQFYGFAIQSTWRLAIVSYICRQSKVTRSDRVRLAGGCTAYWLVTACALLWSPALGAWLLLAPIYRGTNTAVSQYMWHGLQTGSGESSPTSTTILWVPPHQPRLVNGDVVEAPIAHAGVTPWRSSIDGPEAVLGREWAFFDNYHLLHHLHPRAHFTQYPELLEQDAARIERAAAAVFDLGGYQAFIGNLLNLRLDAVRSSMVSPVLSEADLLTRLQAWAPMRSPLCGTTTRWPGRALEPIAAAIWTGTWTSQRARDEALASGSTA